MIFRILFILCLVQSANADELKRFEKMLSQFGSKTRSLEANFIQRKRLHLFKQEVTTHGKLTYQSPDRVRWETFAPDASVVIIQGSRAELRIPNERPKVFDLSKSRALGTLIEQMLVWLGGKSPRGLAKSYSVNIEQQAQGIELHLVPKDRPLQKHIKKIFVSFRKDMLMSSIRIQLVDGDSTLITFSHFKKNQVLPKSVFHQR